MKTKYKPWTSEQITEVCKISRLNRKEIKRYAIMNGRTYSSVYAAIRRYVPTQPIVKQQVTKLKKSNTVVFNNYKSVLVETNSILIEF